MGVGSGDVPVPELTGRGAGARGGATDSMMPCTARTQASASDAEAAPNVSAPMPVAPERRLTTNAAPDCWTDWIWLPRIVPRGTLVFRCQVSAPSPTVTLHVSAPRSIKRTNESGPAKTFSSPFRSAACSGPLGFSVLQIAVVTGVTDTESVRLLSLF